MILGDVNAKIASAAVSPRRIIKATSATEVAHAAAAADVPKGVSLNSAAIGFHVDLQHSNIVEVETGGVFALNASLTSDAQGRAIAAIAGDWIIGTASRHLQVWVNS